MAVIVMVIQVRAEVRIQRLHDDAIPLSTWTFTAREVISVINIHFMMLLFYCWANFTETELYPSIAYGDLIKQLACTYKELILQPSRKYAT